MSEKLEVTRLDKLLQWRAVLKSIVQEIEAEYGVLPGLSLAMPVMAVVCALDRRILEEEKAV